MSGALPGGVDGRPRIHVWPHRDHPDSECVNWRFGAVGRVQEAENLGQAFAFAQAVHRDTDLVLFWHRRDPSEEIHS